MKLIDVTKKFNTEAKCLAYIEKMRWPNGIACVHCGVLNVSTITRNAGKNKRMRIYQCLEKECGKQFSATSGTIFHDSHLPLPIWFIAVLLLCEAKKGMSAHQLKRTIWGQHKGSYKTAWYLCHRIRAAMKQVDVAEEVVDEGRRGMMVQFLWSAGLLDASGVEHDYPVGELERLLLVVSDEESGRADLELDAPDLVPEPRPDLGVEGGERFVEEQHLGLDRQRPGQRDPLLLAARELVRETVREGGEADQLQHLAGPAL